MTAASAMTNPSSASPSVTVIGGHRKEHLLQLVTDAVAKKMDHSENLNFENEQRIPKFDLDEVQLGRVLGRGAFCIVHEVRKIVLHPPSSPDQDNTRDAKIIQNRSFMQEHCRRNGAHCRYAIKRLKVDCEKDASTYVSAVTDLVMEAHFLSKLKHPHIIALRGIANHQGLHDGGIFLVLDRLYESLHDRLIKWKKETPRTSFQKMMDRGGKRQKASWVERLHVVYDLSSAIRYMHSLNIVFRDLKPENVRFDVRDEPKIFDFGLARELPVHTQDSKGTFQMTGETGSLIYMAPEVALSKPYNEHVDVYSLSILAWEIFSAEPPYEGYTARMFQQRVIEGGTRPRCNPSWPLGIQQGLRSGWGQLQCRPNMAQLSSIFKKEILQHSHRSHSLDLDASEHSESHRSSFRGGGSTTDLQ